MKEYAVIYSLYVLLCIIMMLTDDVVVFKRQGEKIVLLILILINSIIAATRPIESADTITYMQTYERSISIINNTDLSYGFSAIFANRLNNSIEIAFIYIMALFKQIVSVRIFFFFISMISNLMIVCSLNSINKYIQVKEKRELISKDNRNSSIFSTWCYYMLLGGVLYSSVTIRAALSIAFGLAFISRMLNKGRKGLLLSCVLELVAMLVHTTGIIFIFMFGVCIVFKMNIKSCIIKVIGLSLTVLYFLNISRYALSAFNNIKNVIFGILHINAFSSYFSNFEFQIQMREGFLIVLTVLLLSLVYFETRTYSIFSILILIGVALYTFAYPVHAISRLADMFIIFLIPMLVNCKRYVNRNKLLIVKLLAVMFYVPQYIMVFARFM